MWGTRRGTGRGAQLSWALPWQLDWSAWLTFQKWTLTSQRCQTRVVLIVHEHISKYWLLTYVRVHAMGFTKSNKAVKTYIDLVVLLMLPAIYIFAVQKVVLSSN